MCIYGNTYVYTYVYLCIHILALAQHICICAHAYHDIIILGLIVPRVLFGLAYVGGVICSIRTCYNDIFTRGLVVPRFLFGLASVWGGHLLDSELLE